MRKFPRIQNKNVKVEKKKSEKKRRILARTWQTLAWLPAFIDESLPGTQPSPLAEHCLWGRFHVTPAELSAPDKDGEGPQAYVLTSLPFKNKFVNPCSRKCNQTDRTIPERTDMIQGKKE